MHPPFYPVFPASWGPPSLQQTFLDFRIHGPAHLCKTDLSNWSQFANSLFCKLGTLKRERQIIHYHSISKSLFQQKKDRKDTKEYSSLWKNFMENLLFCHDFSHFTVCCHHGPEGTHFHYIFPWGSSFLHSLIFSWSQKITLKVLKTVGPSEYLHHFLSLKPHPIWWTNKPSTGTGWYYWYDEPLSCSILTLVLRKIQFHPYFRWQCRGSETLPMADPGCTTS